VGPPVTGASGVTCGRTRAGRTARPESGDHIWSRPDLVSFRPTGRHTALHASGSVRWWGPRAGPFAVASDSRNRASPWGCAPIRRATAVTLLRGASPPSRVGKIARVLAFGPLSNGARVSGFARAPPRPHRLCVHWLPVGSRRPRPIARWRAPCDVTRRAAIRPRVRHAAAPAPIGRVGHAAAAAPSCPCPLLQHAQCTTCDPA
jgi:hypothetical protein